jgi:glycine/D-amino acid oxidase-like deaminating enzyme
MAGGTKVIVIGAGIAGAATAYGLAKAGAAVLLLEAERPAAGASGRNPGFLWLQSKAVGLPLEFSLAGRACQEALGQEIGDFGFRACGGLSFFRDERLRPLLAGVAAERRRAGLPVELLDAAGLQSRCPSLDRSIAGALWNPLDAHQDSRRLVARLVAAAERAGAKVRSACPVAALDLQGGRVAGVRLRGGETLAAGTVVIAAGLAAGALLEPLGLRLPLRPVRYEAAESAPLPISLGPVVCGPGVLRHLGLAAGSEPALPAGQSFTHQAAQYGDGRLQYGCLASDGVALDEPTAAGQALADATWRRDLPALAGIAVERRWAGIVAQAPDYLPFVDATPGIDGLALNCGHAFGNLVGVLSGRMLAAALTGREPPFALAPFAAGRFGRIAPCS